MVRVCALDMRGPGSTPITPLPSFKSCVLQGFFVVWTHIIHMGARPGSSAVDSVWHSLLWLVHHGMVNLRGGECYEESVSIYRDSSYSA